MRDRSERRHHKERMKARARRLLPGRSPEHLADNMAKCSCPMCGNPRKWFGDPTIQEMKAETPEGR